MAAVWITVLLAGVSLPAQETKQEAPKSVASSIHRVWGSIESDFISLAEAMPDEKYGFAPSQGEFKGARSFAQQIKHVACANFAFFNQIEGKTPPDRCDLGGPSPAKTKPELLKYLRDSFAYADKILATIDEKNLLQRVDGVYGGPSTRLGIATLAVWHASDHYGQLVIYLRMNGIIPPASR